MSLAEDLARVERERDEARALIAAALAVKGHGPQSSGDLVGLITELRATICDLRMMLAEEQALRGEE